MAEKIKTIAVMTGGGDCPGLNAVIRAVTKTAISRHKLNVWGIEDGYLGLIENRIRPLDFDDVSGILTIGGTILGSSNLANPFKYATRTGAGKIRRKDVSDKCIANLKTRNIDAMICIGGDGTMASAADFAKKGLTVIGVPKTIDNDLPCTDFTFGFDTAVTTATEAIDKLHTTASSHHRIMVVEVMGRYAGWIALHAGIAGGSDVILIPEIPYKLHKVCEFVLKRSRRGKRFSIIVASEGAKEMGGHMIVKEKLKYSPDPVRLGGIASKLVKDIESKVGLDCREVTLGHIQRGGTPTAFDRALATGLGFKAIEMLSKGVKNHLVVFRDGKYSSVPLKSIAGRIKTVPKNHPLISAAKGVNTSFGI